jgi:lia operon protein LiaG
VEVARGGRDADRLRVETGSIDGRQTLRVVHPTDRVVYRGAGSNSSTQLTVRPDGTWGSGWSLRGGRSVRVSSSGTGVEAHADLRIGVPRGQRLDIHLAAGTIAAENVDGHVRLDTHSGAVTARRMSGDLVIDTGSGAVEVTGMDGDLHVDTGSGAVRVADVSATRVLIDTGSGRVVADGVTADRLVIDTGSGSVELRGSARDVRLDTGSGSVTADLRGALDRLVVDTGSGGVTLTLPRGLDARFTIEARSINVDFPLQVTEQTRRRLRGTAGSGRGSVHIDTGSGAVRVRAQ